jgi:hypothetical protein
MKVKELFAEDLDVIERLMKFKKLDDLLGTILVILSKL